MTEVSVLGELEVTGAEGPVPIRALKLRQLLGALLVAGGQARSADWLADALWGPTPPASAEKLLQVYVSRLRKRLPPGLSVITSGSGYRLELEDDALDATRFERLVEEARYALTAGNPLLAGSLLTRALSLWRGRAFGELADLPFAALEAGRLEQLRSAAVEDRIDADLAVGRHHELIAEVCALADGHPLRERLQTQAMLCLYRAGRHVEALERYARLRAVLDEELGLTPGPEATELQRRILNHDPSLSLPPLTGAAGGLPAPSSVLIGRERELKELDALLDDDAVRLIVLTGSGGSGKTRLAVEAARCAAARFANGAAFVALAPLRDSRRVPGAIAAAVGLEDRPSSELGTLIEFLSGLELLLVVDNVEHLQDAAPVLVAILERAPRITIIATSRSVLHLSREHVYPIQPLAARDATTLFWQRARSAGSDIDADADGETIGRICERLDRLPLAIELAAGHARVVSPQELLAGLEPRLQLLAGGPRDLPARQQTMVAAIAWSHDLLDERARGAFRSLAVFAAGCTAEAARQICGVGIDQISTLVDDNLLERSVTDGGSRYSMLETVREYAAEELRKAGELDATQARHFGYFLDLAEGCNLYAEAELPQDFDTANREQENLRAAIGWARASGRPADALQLAVTLENFWVTHDPREGALLLAELSGPDRQLDPRLRARALRALGGAHQTMGELEPAEGYYRESRAILEDLADEKGIAILGYRLALTAVDRGEIVEGARLLEESLERFRMIGSPRGEAQTIGALGTVARARDDKTAAARLFERSASMCEQIGRPWWQALMLAEASEVALEVGDLAGAAERTTRLLELANRIGDQRRTLLGLAYLACVAARSGDEVRAAPIVAALEAGRVAGADDVISGRYAAHVAQALHAVHDVGTGFGDAERPPFAQLVNEVLARERSGKATTGIEPV